MRLFVPIFSCSQYPLCDCFIFSSSALAAFNLISVSVAAADFELSQAHAAIIKTIPTRKIAVIIPTMARTIGPTCDASLSNFSCSNRISFSFNLISAEVGIDFPIRFAPHEFQNAAPSLFSVPHFGQNICLRCSIFTY